MAYSAEELQNAVQGGAATKPAPRWPELHILLTWLGLVGFLYWFQDVNDVVDLMVFLAVSVLILPLLSRSTTIPFLGSLGGTIMGIIIGLQAIDLVFDIAIIRGRPISDGGAVTLEARRAAWFYYHTMLNASHLNGLLLGMVLCSALGPLIGFTRGSPEVRRRFVLLGVCSSAGTGGYLFVAMPKYLVIRNTQAYYPELFDEWEKVIAARMVLYISVFISLPILFGIQRMVKAEGQEEPAQADRDEGRLKKGR